jgi:hypothetical protein
MVLQKELKQSIITSLAVLTIRKGRLAHPILPPVLLVLFCAHCDLVGGWYELILYFFLDVLGIIYSMGINIKYSQAKKEGCV